MVTVWSKKAKLQLQKAFNFIKQDSLQNAEKVRNEIIIQRILSGLLG